MLKTTSPGLNSFKSTIPSFGVVRRAYGTSPKEYSDAIIDRYGDPLADVYNKLKKEKAIGFISGGKPLGSSVSANNIVGFNRNIKPRPNNLQSIISNLSSSIFNNFKDNVTSRPNINKKLFTNIIKSYKNIKNNVTSRPNINKKLFTNIIKSYKNIKNNVTSNIKETVVEKRNQITNPVKNLISNYKNIFPLNQNQKKVIKKQEGIKPFGGFFDNLKKAASFIAFFGSKKNLDRISKNIQNLKDTFIKTFDIAKLLRKAIKKIFKQLSDIKPGGGGGILDNIFSEISGFVSGLLGGLIPGGNKDNRSGRQGQIPQRGRQTSGMKLPRFPGGKVGKLIAGAGLATGAGAAISGLSQPGQTEEIEPAETTLEAPGSVLDKFNSVLDRFDRILDGMLKGKKPDKSTSPSSPASSGGGESPGGAGPGGGDTSGSSPEMGAGAQGPKGAATRALLDSISFAEGTTTHGYHTQFGGGRIEDLSKHPDQVIHGGKYSSAAFGRYQFMPRTWGDVMGGAMTPERQDAAAVKLTISRLDRAGIRVRNEDELEALLQKEGISPRIAAALAPEWASFPTLSGQSYHGQPVKKLQTIQNVFNERLKVQGSVATPTPTVAPAPEQAQPIQVQPYQPNPQSPSAGPSQQTQPQVTVVPIGGQAPQVQSVPSGSGIIAPPPPKQNGPTAPFLPSANPNNFLTLYSRMVYNIVDG